MNQTQKNHAINRIVDIKMKLQSDIRKKHTKEGTIFSDKKKATLIRKGQITLKPGVTEVGNRHYVGSTISFNGEKETVKNEKAITIEVREVQEEASRVIDQIMLGKEDEVLQALKDFGEFKVKKASK